MKVVGRELQLKGPIGEMTLTINDNLELVRNGSSFSFRERRGRAKSEAGTMRSLALNVITGVSKGFEKRLELRGVGYRAQVKGRALNLQLGYSHPIVYNLPEGVAAETPSQTEVVIKGADKQKVGQAASEIRAFRPPEPYKGKGVRYADERILRKEGKKK